MRNPRLRRISVGIASSLIAVTVVELLSALLFHLFAARFTFFDPQRFAPRADQLRGLRLAYHPDLGWLRRFDTPLGERPRSTFYRRALLASFGDSFTFCDEVGDRGTWQTALAKRVQADVYNFGMKGYGTDQAYLRFQRDFPKANTPLVTLGFLIENINRVVSIYRKFYYQSSGLPLTKPRFEVVRGELELHPNPVRRVEEVERLYDPRFLAEIGRNDWWYNRDNYPILAFPYTRILFNRRLWLEAIYARGSQRVGDLAPRPWEDLWQLKEPRELMEAIFVAFAREATERGATPILMLFPKRNELESASKGDRIEAAERVHEICRRHALRCFDGIAALSRTLAGPKDIAPLYRRKGHLSRLGNQRLADEFYEFLQSNALLPP